MVRVKMYITIDVDEEEYPVPADGQVGEELEDGIREYFYDIEGADIKTIRTIMEGYNDKQSITNRLPKLYRSFPICEMERTRTTKGDMG